MEESPSYTHIVTVAESEIDELGHANNVAYVRWVQDAAVAHSEAVGLGYAGYVKLGGVFVIRRHEIDYLRSALRGDRLAVRTRISSVAAAQCERRTTVVRESDGVECARAVTTWVWVDGASGRPGRIHDDVYRAFGFEPRKRVKGGEGAPHLACSLFAALRRRAVMFREECVRGEELRAPDSPLASGFAGRGESEYRRLRWRRSRVVPRWYGRRLVARCIILSLARCVRETDREGLGGDCMP